MGPGNDLLIIGIGNELAGDDGVGLYVARRLQARLAAELPAARVIEHSGEPASLIAHWVEAKASTVIVIDAVYSGGKPGELHRFDANAGPLPAVTFTASSHALGLAEAVEIARATDQLPRRLIIYGIEGEQFYAGSGLSPQVAEAIPDVVERVTAEIQRWV